MPRRPKDQNYDAPIETYQDYYQRGLALDEEARAVRAKVSSLNKEAERDGVDSGAIALKRRLRRRFPDPEKRMAAARRYAEVLVKVHDEAEAELLRRHNGGPQIEEEPPRPFGDRAAA